MRITFGKPLTRDDVGLAYHFACVLADIGATIDAKACGDRGDAVDEICAIWDRYEVDFLWRETSELALAQAASAVNPGAIRFADECGGSWLEVARLLSGKRRRLIHSLLGRHPEHTDWTRRDLAIGLLDKVWMLDRPTTWRTIREAAERSLRAGGWHQVGVLESIDLAEQSGIDPHDPDLFLKFGCGLDFSGWSAESIAAQVAELQSRLRFAYKQGLMAPYPYFDTASGAIITAWDAFKEGISNLVAFDTKLLRVELEKERDRVLKELPEPTETLQTIDPLPAAISQENGKQKPAKAAPKPKREWTVAQADSEIRRHLIEYKETYDAAKSGKAGAHEAALKLFGRNKMAAKLGIPLGTVSKTGAWEEIKENLGVGGSIRTPQRKIGHDMALEAQAEENGDAVAADLDQRETISLIRKSNLKQSEKAALIEKLELREQTVDQVLQTLKLLS